jgi:hypothetical protein
METSEIAHGVLLNEAKDVVEQYRQIGGAALADAETWPRQGALSRFISRPMHDPVLVADDQDKSSRSIRGSN